MQGGSRASGASFGPYEILTSLGQGGGGQVFRAWDPRLHREVALKILREQRDADPDRVRRFVFEARAASALNHPNIVTVFDAAVDGDTPYIVSELIDGATLREEIRRGPLPLKRLLDIAAQIAEGLAAAHDAGIVHRDLKPENIMVTRSGRAKILDFGLAWSGPQKREIEPSSNDMQTQTELGLLVGTIPYMSPEQARGAATDFRTDQFSFGLIMYEMATGRLAFRRDTPAATLDAIINDELPPMSPLDARVRTPVLLRWIIERCLAKEPGDRYTATADLHRDLRTLRDRLSEALPHDTATSAPARTTLRKRALAVAALVAALIAGAILGGLALVPQPTDRVALRFSPLSTAPGYEGFPSWSPDGKSIAYAAEVDGILQIFQRDLLSPAPSPVTEAAYDCKHPFWSPDGSRIYYVSMAKDREGIWSIPAAGGTPQVVVLNAVRGAISHDGRTLAFLRDEEQGDIVSSLALYLATPSGREPWSRDAVEAAATRYAGLDAVRFAEAALAFSPDGTRLGLYGQTFASETGGWQLWVVPLSGGSPYLRLQSLRKDAAPRESSFTWMPDSRHVVVAVSSASTFESHLWMADLQRDRVWPLTSTPVSEYYPSASPVGDGDELVFARDDSHYDVVEIGLQSRTTVPLLVSARKESDPVWAPDGSRLAYVTDRRGQDEIWWADRNGRLDQPLITQRNFSDDNRTIMLDAPTFSRDGQRIAYLRTGGSNLTSWVPLRIWYSPTTGGTTAQPILPVTPGTYQGAPTWSPDGQWIAFAEWKDQKWRLVKVRVGSDERKELRTDGIPNAAPQWSPKDDWITWETEKGLVLVSPDGASQQSLSDDSGELWHAHTWSKDGSEILAIRETSDLQLVLVAVEARPNGRTRVLVDLGPSPPANNPVKGLSLSADGRSVLTSMLRQRSDLWLLQGLRQRDPASWWVRLFRRSQ